MADAFPDTQQCWNGEDLVGPDLLSKTQPNTG